MFRLLLRKNSVLITALALFLSIFQLPVGVYADTGDDTNSEPEVFVSDEFRYTVLENGDAMIVGCSAYGDVVIPETVDGHKVTRLDRELFYGAYGITSVFIPSTIDYFGMWDYVFSYCYDLKAINVDENNPVLRSVDGVLYSADMSILFNYPNAREGEKYSVPAETTTLCCTSFAYSPLKVLTLENPDTEWYTYTFYGDEALTVVYKNGGYTQQLVESGREFGPVFTSDPDYVPPAEDPSETEVSGPDPEDVQAADMFSLSVWNMAGDSYELNLEDESSISALREQYEALTPEAKALVKPEYLEMLESAEQRIAGLKEAEENSESGTSNNEETGEKIVVDDKTGADTNKTETAVGTAKTTVKAPGKATIRSLKGKRKSASLSVKKMKGRVKYKVQYRIKGKKKWKTKYIRKTSCTFKRLKSGKRYQFRVRAYKTVNGEKIYGKWSKIKTVKIK